MVHLSGDGFFYRNLVSGAETSVEARFREAEEELEQGRFQEQKDEDVEVWFVVSWNIVGHVVRSIKSKFDWNAKVALMCHMLMEKILCVLKSSKMHRNLQEKEHQKDRFYG